jgi:hypothetical protein
MGNNTISTKKIIVFILIIVCFMVLAYIIANAFASECPKGLKYDHDLKKCVEVCTDLRKYDQLSNSCLCPKNYNDIGGECRENCKFLGDDYKQCGQFCYNTETSCCFPGGVICDKDRSAWNQTCCEQDQLYIVDKNKSIKYFPKG